MRSSYAFVAEGLSDIDEFGEVPDAVVRFAVQALNKTTRRARPAAARGIREQVAFPARYLSSQDGRLAITKYAKAGDLEGIVSAASRPTSLARFASGRQRKRGVRVQVKPGQARYLRRAFIMNLRRGDQSGGNRGLAVRSPTKPAGAYKPKQIAENLWLLYGPSVDQVFQTVREDISEDTVDFLEYEFNRLLDLHGVV